MDELVEHSNEYFSRLLGLLAFLDKSNQYKEDNKGMDQNNLEGGAGGGLVEFGSIL
jgi:hypothetical protein